jgi:hypothetical protein
MVLDLIEHKALIGKSSSAVKEILGKPDNEESDWYGYDVVTIGRCRFWKCFLNVGFNSSQRVESVALSD